MRRSSSSRRRRRSSRRRRKCRRCSGEGCGAMGSLRVHGVGGSTFHCVGLKGCDCAGCLAVTKDRLRIHEARCVETTTSVG
jgi:hypothetical protein